MVKIRKSNDRGVTRASWLESKHTFGFGTYYHPAYINFGTLQVINEDVVSPSGGFASHSHHDMEIITYVLEGQLEHKDSLGNGSIISAGEVQHMTAGVGIIHSEFNPSNEKPVHLLQIWIRPHSLNLTPAYQQKDFRLKRQNGQLTLLVSASGEGESLVIHQDAKIYALDLDESQSFFLELKPDRTGWIQMARGTILLNGQMLEQGDGAAVTHEKALNFVGCENSEVLIFDLAKD